MSYNKSVSQTDLYGMNSKSATAMSASLEERDMLKEARNGSDKDSITASFGGNSAGGGGGGGKRYGLSNLNIPKNISCSMCHIPYSLASVPFNVKMKKCAVCRKGRVPDVLLATLEVPEFLQVTGK